ncbi:MAG TPA: hypothetical protein VJP60_02205 [Rhizomicrobium sp.]|nr:hypothetical protein [Rhizomicrobium sp.]
MSSTSDLALSPTFERARALSKVLRWFFIINLGVTAVWVASVLALLIWPQAANYSPDGSLISVAGLPMPERITAVAATIIRTAPALVLLYHAIKIFGCFARGEVFAATPITHIRAAGFWTIIWAFAPALSELVLQHQHVVKFNLPLLAFGIATFIAAHVMGEAQRIADENASIL